MVWIPGIPENERDCYLVENFLLRSFLVLLCHYGFLRCLVKRFGYLGAALATSCSGWMTLFFGSLAVWLVGAGPTIWGGRWGERGLFGVGIFFFQWKFPWSFFLRCFFCFFLLGFGLTVPLVLSSPRRVQYLQYIHTSCSR